MAERKFRMKKSKRRENSVKPIIHINQMTFNKRALTTSERVE